MEKEDKSFNRLILIGNGFDLLHGLKTRYSDFVKNYLVSSVNNFFINNYHSDNLLEITYQDSFRTQPTPSYDVEDIFSFFEELDTKYNSMVKVNVNYKSTFFKLIHKSVNLGWVDIEKVYYTRLTQLYKRLNNDENNNIEIIKSVQQLNSDLNFICELLRQYLKKEQEKYNIKDVINRANLRVAFQDLEEYDCPHYKINRNNKIDKVLFLNFNYTEPNFTDHLSAANDLDWEEINIHGTLTDDMIFGYGDELDEYYKMFEKLGEDEWLKGFKSFGYLQNHYYNNLLGFIEEKEYQVFIAGHSCGLSDKTLLNQIFEHPNCKSIKVYYHTFKEGERIGEDTFNDTIYNIARIMDNKVKMRSIVSKKTQSRELNTLYNLAPVKLQVKTTKS